ncbi:hypothetical protein TYRP_011215 [Tyrophagus putrescentiae]|nr:hypothetical protein TYRP_011215 [Tyrophagus putrescentiae]
MLRILKVVFYGLLLSVIVVYESSPKQRALWRTVVESSEKLARQLKVGARRKPTKKPYDELLIFRSLRYEPRKVLR